MRKETKLVEAVQEMNSITGSIGLHSEMLGDISSKFLMVMDGMDTAEYNGKSELYFREHHHELRLLSALLRYVMVDVKKDTEDIITMGENLFEEVVRKDVEA